MAETHVLDEIGAYALGGLEREEAVRVEAHLAGCAACRAEMSHYRQLETALRERSGFERAPAGTWHQIAAQLEPRPAPVAMPLPAGTQAPPVRASRMRLIILGWAATAAVLAGVVSWVTWDQLSGDPGPGVAQLASNGDGLVVPLSGKDASGRLYMSEDRTQGGMAVRGLPVLGSDETYEVWFVRHDQTRWSGGTFNVDSRGQALVKVAVPESLDEFDGVAISTEPAGGSDVWGPDVLAGPIYEK